MLWLKAFHIIFVVTWFAGLFYLPRLFVYHAQTEDAAGRQRFVTMERKLFVIMTIGGSLALLFGIALVALNPALLEFNWLRLKLVLVEYEIGWIPFVLQGWDRSVRKFDKNTTLSISKPPSEYFNRQVYATFFNDYVGGQTLSWWGQDNMMWSSDYPHPNSTWPKSRETVARNLGHLTPECRDKVVRSTAAKLYHIRLPGSG